MAWQLCLSGQNLATQWEKSIGIGAKMAKKLVSLAKKSKTGIIYFTVAMATEMGIWHH